MDFNMVALELSRSMPNFHTLSSTLKSKTVQLYSIICSLGFEKFLCQRLFYQTSFNVFIFQVKNASFLVFYSWSTFFICGSIRERGEGSSMLQRPAYWQ